jgi:AAA15 family ATPase/GTPase
MFGMISKLKVKNFRRAKKLVVGFGSITVIRGASAKGKSSMIGGLKWLAFNQPSGDRFINWDSTFALTKVMVDGHTIIRKRSGRDNYYKLDGKKYEAMRTGVPSDIANILNLSPLNFHRQHSTPFWFGETAGEVNRQLNAIVNLEIIDQTSTNLARSLRETRSEISVIRIRMDEAKSEKDSLKYIIRLSKELRLVEALSSKKDRIAENALQLSNLLSTLQRHRKEADRLQERATEAGIVLVTGESYEKTRLNRFVLQELIETAKVHKEEMSVVIPDLRPLEKAYDEWNVVKRQHETLTCLFGQAEEYEEVIYQEELTAKTKQKEFDKKMGKKCPLCKSKLK